MNELMDVREVDGRYEILTRIDSDEGEFWEPLATSLVSTQLLQLGERTFADVTVADALRAEGWLAPSEAGEFTTWLSAAKRVVDASTFGPHEDTPFGVYNEWVAAIEALKRLVGEAEWDRFMYECSALPSRSTGA